MGLTVVTGPASEPVSLAELKTHCRQPQTYEDGLLAGYLLAARTHVETYLRRALVTQTWDYTLDDWPTYSYRINGLVRQGYRIILPKPPAQSITSINYVDTSGATQVLAADQYRVLDINQERGEAYVEQAYGVTWPSIREQAQAVTVRFVCGYDNAVNPFPDSIRQAILLLAGGWAENREAVNVGNIVNEMPFGVEALLFPYRIFY